MFPHHAFMSFQKPLVFQNFPNCSKKQLFCWKLLKKKSFTEGQSDENMTAEKEHDVSP